MPAHNDVTGDALISKAATPEYRENHEKIFGNKPIQRGSWRYDPELRKLIPLSEWRERERSKLIVHVDQWDAYESPVSGNVISNRKQRDRDLKESGCRQYEGKEIEVQEANRHNAYKRKELINTLMDTAQRTYYEIEHGYRRPRE